MGNRAVVNRNVADERKNHQRRLLQRDMGPRGIKPDQTFKVRRDL